jgi:hypothetical protein
MSQVRRSIHLNLDGDCDLSLHLFRRSARPLGDDLDIVIGHVWIGFNGKAM